MFCGRTPGFWRCARLTTVDWVCPGAYHETHDVERLRRDEIRVSNQSVCFSHCLCITKPIAPKQGINRAAKAGSTPHLECGNRLANEEIFAMARVHRSSHRKMSRKRLKIRGVVYICVLAHNSYQHQIPKSYSNKFNPSEIIDSETSLSRSAFLLQ